MYSGMMLGRSSGRAYTNPTTMNQNNGKGGETSLKQQPEKREQTNTLEGRGLAAVSLPDRGLGGAAHSRMIWTKVVEYTLAETHGLPVLLEIQDWLLDLWGLVRKEGAERKDGEGKSVMETQRRFRQPTSFLTPSPVFSNRIVGLM